MKNYRGQDLPKEMPTVAYDRQCHDLFFSVRSGNIEHFEAIRTFHRIIDSACANIKDYTSCSVNCSYCCDVYVETSKLEIDLIKYEINSLPGFIREEVMSRIGEFRNRWDSFKKVNGIPITDSQRRLYFDQKIPCAFLLDGKCSIYNVRPYKCRVYFVFTSPEKCKTLDNPPLWDNKYFMGSSLLLLSNINWLLLGELTIKALPEWFQE